MKYLGIDYGGKRIGLAIGDDETFIAAPFEILETGDLSEAVEDLSLILKEEDVGAIVVGLPVSLKESGEGQQARLTRRFGAALERESKIKVIYEDERLTSKQAASLLKEALPERKDAVAAMIILQSYFDKLRNPKS